MTLLRALVFFFVLLVSSTGIRVAADELAIPQAYVEVAARYQIPANVLYALALTESAQTIDSRRRPWPWTLNIEGKGTWYKTREAALKAANEAIANGVDSIDIGFMQINWRVHRDRFTSLTEAFDPWRNLEVGAQILSEYCAEKDGDWYAAIGRYRSKTPDFAKEHQTRFADNLTRLVLGNAK